MLGVGQCVIVGPQHQHDIMVHRDAFKNEIMEGYNSILKN